MKVTRVAMRHFRNHSNSKIAFVNGINAILGNNGQGKTNVLEAVSYLSLTKSFYAANDATVLQIGQAMFEVEGSIVTDRGTTYTVRAAYSRTGEKAFTVNGTKPQTLASVIGQFPIVVLSPENNAITFGGPSERRRFMDIVLSQISCAYLEDILEYRRVLKQRNKLLLNAKLERNTAALLQSQIEPWTESLVQRGGRIIRHRQLFINEFRDYVKRAYADLVQSDEAPEVAYVTIPGTQEANGELAINDLLRKELQARSSEELRRGTTLVGPHRDDLQLKIDGIGVQHFASQGQHKTMLVALKIAEFFYLKERRDEVPIFLLDDVFSELDDHRSRLLLSKVESLGQSFITTTEESVFHDAIEWNGTNKKFYVEAGTIRPC